MSVDFFSCAICSKTFPDCGTYYRCDCGEIFCSHGCAKTDYSQYDCDGNIIDEENEDWDEEEPGIRCICSKNDANDQILSAALLKHFKINRDDAMKIWRAQID